MVASGAGKGSCPRVLLEFVAPLLPQVRPAATPEHSPDRSPSRRSWVQARSWAQSPNFYRGNRAAVFTRWQPSAGRGGLAGAGWGEGSAPGARGWIAISPSSDSKSPLPAPLPRALPSPPRPLRPRQRHRAHQGRNGLSSPGWDVFPFTGTARAVLHPTPPASIANTGRSSGILRCPRDPAQRSQEMLHGAGLGVGAGAGPRRPR